ncbi:MAG: hypothetical protein HY078_04555 [Elusimicrobia bacterium]|nr:hypothetical protein [Elusimicrobiota bacterium]
MTRNILKSLPALALAVALAPSSSVAAEHLTVLPELDAPGMTLVQMPHRCPPLPPCPGTPLGCTHTPAPLDRHGCIVSCPVISCPNGGPGGSRPSFGKSFPKSTDREALSYKLYEALFSYAAKNQTTHDRRCPRGVCSTMVLSDLAASHGETVRLTFSLRMRAVEINDGANRVFANYDLPQDLRERFGAEFALEGPEVTSSDRNSAAAVLFEALPKTHPNVAGLSDKYGNKITCSQDRQGSGGHSCEFQFAR